MVDLCMKKLSIFNLVGGNEVKFMQTIDLWGIIAWALRKELLHFIKLFSFSIDRHSQARRHKKRHTKRIFFTNLETHFFKEC